MIKLYGIGKKDQLHFTDTPSERYLAEHGIEYTTNPLRADVFICDREETRKYTLLRSLTNRLIVWTNEPRFSTSRVIRPKGPVFMNVYSGEVFLNNLHFLGSYHYDASCDLGVDLRHPPGRPQTRAALQQRKKCCAAVFAYRDPGTTALYVDGVNIDLLVPRQALALYFQERGRADIVGSNWPASVKILESSGFESDGTTWWDRKIDLLTRYRFTICFENTAFPYYCTEKLWQAIAAGCLPIYYGKGTTIYETFPTDSFIDAARFDSPAEVLDYVESLSPEEHLHRYNRCLDVLHENCRIKREDHHLTTVILDRFIERVRQLAA
jgi:hypothetical protein